MCSKYRLEILNKEFHVRDFWLSEDDIIEELFSEEEIYKRENFIQRDISYMLEACFTLHNNIEEVLISANLWSHNFRLSMTKADLKFFKINEKKGIFEEYFYDELFEIVPKRKIYVIENIYSNSEEDEANIYDAIMDSETNEFICETNSYNTIPLMYIDVYSGYLKAKTLEKKFAFDVPLYFLEKVKNKRNFVFDRKIA